MLPPSGQETSALHPLWDSASRGHAWQGLQRQRGESTWEALPFLSLRGPFLSQSLSPPKLQKSCASEQNKTRLKRPFNCLRAGEGQHRNPPGSSPSLKIPGEGVWCLSQQQTLLDKPGQPIQRPGQQADRKGESLRAKQEKNKEGRRRGGGKTGNPRVRLG